MSTAATFTPTKRYPEHPFTTKGRLIITPELKGQIDYLHKKIGDIEWSGFLFYKILSGSLEDISNLVIRAESIYLLDIGTTGYTSREGQNSISQEEVLDMYETIPGANEEDMRYGFIHTHHNMNSFFSGTDMSELHDNVDAYTTLLSLIVNKKNEYVAKIAFKSIFKHSFSNFGNDSNIEKEVLCLIDMNVTEEGYEAAPFLKERYKRIKEKIEERRKATYTPHTHSWVGGYNPHKNTAGFHAQNSFKQGDFGENHTNFGQKSRGTFIKGKDESDWEENSFTSEGAIHSFSKAVQEETQEEAQMNLDFPFPERTVKKIDRQSVKKKLSNFLSGSSNNKGFGVIKSASRSELMMIINTWLEKGLGQIAPHYDSSKPLGEKLDFLKKFYAGMYKTSMFEKFISDMQEHLVDAAWEYSPLIVSQKVSEIIKSYRQEGGVISEELEKVASQYSSYCSMIKL